jgi:hypothetical protein
MRIIMSLLIVSSMLFSATTADTSKCDRVELGLLDEIVSCPNGDYHVKYVYTNTIDIGSNRSQLSEKTKKVLELKVLSIKK